MSTPPKRPSRQSPPPPPTPPQSKREQMKDALGQVMQQVKDQRQAVSASAIAEVRRKRQRHVRAILLTVLASLALVISMVVMIPKWRHPFPVPTGAAADSSARRAIAYAATVVDSYRRTRGRLPISLAETGINFPGIGYAIRGDRYELTVMVDSRPVRFTSGDDLTAFKKAGP